METIEKHMTPCPHSVGKSQNLQRAAEYMREHKVRHLPVLHGGQLVGLLSDRDIVLLEGVDGLTTEEITVEDAMSLEPYAVAPATPLTEVLDTMARRGIGSCLVMEGQELRGIYTSTDAVRMLAKVLQSA